MANGGVSSTGGGGPSSGPSARIQQQRAAFDQIRNKGQVIVPDIDFTKHTMEDGQVVSTQLRVVKDVQAPAAYKPTPEQFYDAEGRPSHAFLKVRWLGSLRTS